LAASSLKSTLGNGWEEHVLRASLKKSLVLGATEKLSPYFLRHQLAMKLTVTKTTTMMRDSERAGRRAFGDRRLSVERENPIVLMAFTITPVLVYNKEQQWIGGRNILRLNVGAHNEEYCCLL
jgi:hypothetical protein